jgi:hypothetical protein
MLSVEADVRSLKALKPMGNDARFVPIELPVSSAPDDPAIAGLSPPLADDPASHG